MYCWIKRFHWISHINTYIWNSHVLSTLKAHKYVKREHTEGDGNFPCTNVHLGEDPSDGYSKHCICEPGSKYLTATTTITIKLQDIDASLGAPVNQAWICYRQISIHTSSMIGTN